MELPQDRQLKQQAAATATTISPSGSPRRRKAPLDLDAALYLQSQAQCVQEPSRLIRSGSGGSNNNKNKPTTGYNNISSTNSSNRSNQTVNSTSGPQIASNKQVSFSLAAGGSYCYNAFNYYNPQSCNISVDYIDCLSNNDLASNANVSPIVSSDSRVANNMRGIPTCGRRHLRFHRNRIEPARESALQQELEQQQQQKQFQLPDDATTLESLTTTSDQSASQVSSISLMNSNLQQQQRQNMINSSVLYPISASEAKKRTYFIGSVGQDSLLGEEELLRYFPNGRVSIFVCTWNQNRKRSPLNLNDLLLPDQLVYMPDIYAIGIQEAFSSQQDYLKDWEIELQTTLGPNHVLLHSCSLGVLHLGLFVRRDLIWFCSMPEESVYNSRSMPTNMIKTKGAVSIAFRFFGTSFMFTNCHFPAHENRLKDRIDEYQRIINSIDLPKNLKLLKPRYLSNDSTARFDCVFFMGDLNFRLDQRTFDETINILEDIFQQKEPSYEALIQNDELIKAMETGQAFHGFDESQIKFPPTYKFLAQTNKYDRQTRRIPSYTDRILFRSKRQRHIQCLIYDWLPQLISSDHKPVYCLFDVLIRPGHEQNMVGTLNAGLFQRTIYLEALKRRAEDPDGMRENGAGGNLICSIS